MRSPVSIPPRPDDLGLTIRGWAAGASPSRPSPRRAAGAAILAAGTLLLATALAIALESGDIGIEDASPVYLLAVVAVGSQFGMIPPWQKQGGWEVYEADGVSPVYCGPNAREDALSYARQRAGYAPTEIRILDAEWNVVEAILPQLVRGLV